MSAFVEYSHCQASQSCRKTLYGAGETCESRTADVAPVAPYGQHFSGYGVVGACLGLKEVRVAHKNYPAALYACYAVEYDAVRAVA